MSSKYAWRIERMGAHGLLVPGEKSPVGLTGPRDAPASLLEKLGKREGDRFRVLDDDGIVYYYGRIVGEFEGFEPLEDYGEGGMGATEIQYLSREDGMTWMRL